MRREEEEKVAQEKEDEKQESERRIKGEAIKVEIAGIHEEILELIDRTFAIYPCGRCNDVSYSLLSINSVGNAVHLQCEKCDKKTWFKSIDDVLDDDLHALYEEQAELIWKLGTLSMSYNNNKPPRLFANAEYKKSTSKRRSIPKQVKQEVWQRDGGKCIQCGSNEKLEYDHIIPVAKGGANTTRNIQLLCENCNRTKSAKIE